MLCKPTMFLWHEKLTFSSPEDEMPRTTDPQHWQIQWRVKDCVCFTAVSFFFLRAKCYAYSGRHNKVSANDKVGRFFLWRRPSVGYSRVAAVCRADGSAAELPNRRWAFQQHVRRIFLGFRRPESRTHPRIFPRISGTFLCSISARLTWVLLTL